LFDLKRELVCNRPNKIPNSSSARECSVELYLFVCCLLPMFQIVSLYIVISRNVVKAIVSKKAHQFTIWNGGSMSESDNCLMVLCVLIAPTAVFVTKNLVLCLYRRAAVTHWV